MGSYIAEPAEDEQITTGTFDRSNWLIVGLEAADNNGQSGASADAKEEGPLRGADLKGDPERWVRLVGGPVRRKLRKTGKRALQRAASAPPRSASARSR